MTRRLSQGLLLLVVGAVCGFASVQSVQAEESEVRSDLDLVLYNLTLVSPDRNEPLERAWVAIEEGRIVEVGSTNDSEPPSATQLVDVEGSYVTPGLIDSHVHLAGVPGFPIPTPGKLKTLAKLYDEQLPRSYLYHGFTTLIDLNVVDPGALTRFESASEGPDLFHCGSAITVANGYPMAYLPEGIRFKAYPNFLWDARQADSIPKRYNAEDQTPEKAIGRISESGAICAKAFVEDGFGPAKIWPIPTAEMIGRAHEASRESDLTFAVHANSFDAYRFAFDAGVDVFVHGLWNWDGRETIDGELPAAMTYLLDELIDNQTDVMPTQRVLAGLRDLFDPSFLDQPGLPHVLPQPLLDWYRSDTGKWFREELRQDYDGAPDVAVRTGIQTGLDRGAAVTSYLAENGGALLFGSDTPSGPLYTNPPGLNGYLELLALEESGLTPQQVLRAATISNAHAFGLSDRYGTITAGKIAHLLILKENPLESIAAYDSLTQVVLDGKMIDRSTLSAQAAR